MRSVHRCKKRAVARADGSGLPTDVLFEVLLRFPADELCRLRLVCRSWRSLTSDPIFARIHASRHPLVVAGFKITHHKYEVRVVDLSGNIVKRMPLAQPSHTLNTQQDMVCLTGKLDHSPGYVLDLAAGKAVAALWLSDDDQGLSLSDVISPFLLGHVPSTGEYKVFYSHARTMHGEKGIQAFPVCYVMTIGDGGRWRVTPRPPGHISSSYRERVVVGGVAYFLLDVLWWLGKSSNVEPDDIAVFDLATEVWRPAILQGPLSSHLASDDEKVVYHQYKMRLTTMDGCLVFVYHDHRQDTSIIDIWFLSDMGVCNGLWNKRYSIRSATDCPSLRNSYPLLLLDDGRIVFWDREQEIQVLRVYDPRTDKWADLASLGSSYFSVSMYQENLLCPGL